MSDTPSPGMVAIACVVESSLTLAAEWSRILLEYISPLLKRLSEIHASHQFRIGVVTYATADTRPTPLLSKRFFASLQPITRELRDEPGKLGIGHTSSGGTRGMAALEGLVAAVELFDALASSVGPNASLSQSSLPKDGTSRPNSPICHIFHVAASPPDDALRPLWNKLSPLDYVTWETLPSELRKRNINLSIISLRKLSRFPELHSCAAAGSSQQPWFNVRSPHSLLLSGFTVQPKSNKRFGENLNVEKTSESKRPRTQHFPSPDVSLNPPDSNAPLVTQAPPVSVSSLPPPSFNPPAQQPQAPTKPPIVPKQTTLQQIDERFRLAQMQLQGVDNAISAATASGNVQHAEALKQERDKQLAAYLKFKTTVTAYAQSQARVGLQMQQDAGNDGGASTAPNPVSSTNQLSQSAMRQMQPSPTHKDQLSLSFGSDTGVLAPDLQATTKLLQNRTANLTFPPFSSTNQNSGPHGMQLPSNVPPQIVSHMQQSIELQRNRQTIGQIQGMDQGSGMNASVVDYLRPPSTSAVWQGTLMWTGSDAATQGRKEVQSKVIASIQSGGDSRLETWPNTMMLTPSREPAVSLQDLQIWMKRHKPILCTFHPQPRSVDPKSNESHYRSLVQLLMAKNIYAVAAWTLPSGVQENNVLVFPVNGSGLAGAFFPVTGIPELPKPTSGISLPTAAAQFQRMTSDQQKQLVTQMRQKQHMQAKQPQQQEPSGTGGSSQSRFSFNATQPQVCGNQSLVSAQGGGIGSMSLEIMQSFMHRSAEGPDSGT